MQVDRIKLLTRPVLFLVLVILPLSAAAQVSVEKSKDKVVISGVTYYIHEVRKGETAYSISKAYGITVEQLNRENPPAVYGINVGQTLRIPALPDSAQAPARSQPKDGTPDSKYIFHTLKPGETIYFLSKTYGVSENDIIQCNPGIDITRLSVGMGIIVPRKEFMTSQQNFEAAALQQKPENAPAYGATKNQPPSSPATGTGTETAIIAGSQAAVQVQGGKDIPPQEKGFFYHKVQTGESLSSIAELYGLTVRELRRANRDLRFPQVGDYVKVPGAGPKVEPEVITVVQDTSKAEPEPVAPVLRPEGFTDINHLSGSFNVAVLLPFYLSENAVRTDTDSSKLVKGKKTYKVTKRNEDWIYPGSIDFIEMYQGILLAADTLRSLGADITINTFDIKRDTVALTRIINSGKLDKMDLIIGPVYPWNLAIVAEYARDKGIPVVSPVPLFENSVLHSYPDLFLSTSTLEIAQNTIARKLGEYAGQNFIFIHSDSLRTDNDVMRFKRLILSEIGSKVPYEEIKFRELLFYSRSMFDNDSINRLSHALSDKLSNIIVIASEDPPVISETVIDIHSLSKKYDVRVFGYPVLRDLNNLDPKYLFDLDVMVYSPYWIDYSQNDITRFNSVFREKFLTEPGEKSYAWQGYDLVYYFISGLSMHGREFLDHPYMHHPDLLQSDYDFYRKAETDGWENRHLFLVHYGRDYDLRLVDEADNSPGY